jgi:hypothetical protein
MIAIPRALARRFRTVARRCVASPRQHGPAPPLLLNAEAGTLTLTAHFGEVVVALTVPVAECGEGSLTVPFSLLDAFEGISTDLVTLAGTSKIAGSARWLDRGLPRSVTFDQVEPASEWPKVPERSETVPLEFPSVMHEAGRTTAREPGKYAMHRIQVRGKAGEVIGTDAKHCLIQGGFEFGFAEDLHLPAVPVFGSKEFAGEEDVQLGLAADGWFSVRIGSWNVWLKHDDEVRFPDVTGAIPRAVGTRLTIADGDADLVIGDLHTWPKDFDGGGCVTLDLSDRVVVRARVGQRDEVVERTLSESSLTGTPIRLVLNREHVGRALSLGFRQFACASPERPVVARDNHRLFLSAALDPASAVLPAESKPASRTGSSKRTTPSVPAQPAGSKGLATNSPLPDPILPRSTVMPAREPVSAERNGHAEPVPDAIDLLNEAEAVRTLLAEAATRIIRLVGALKHFRKERRVLASAFSSLRQLNLGQ